MKTIHAVAFQRGDWWIAQCLEYSIATQARSLEKLLPELDRLLKVQVAASLEMGIEPFYGFSPAPRKYWEMYEKASTRVEPVQRSLQEDSQFEARVAA
jgi:hypothetical protein